MEGPAIKTAHAQKALKPSLLGPGSLVLCKEKRKRIAWRANYGNKMRKHNTINYRKRLKAIKQNKKIS